MARRKETVAQALTRATGKAWTAVRDAGEFGWRYRCEDGRVVHACAESVLGWDGYSDTEFDTVYYDQHGFRYGMMPYLAAPSGHDLSRARAEWLKTFPEDSAEIRPGG